MNTPTLAFVDNQDGTGGVATVTSSSSGAVNTIRAAQFNGDLGKIEWETVGSRTDDGDVALSLDKGYFWFLCLSTLLGEATASDPIYSLVSDEADSSYWRCMLAAAERLQALIFPEMGNFFVYVQSVANRGMNVMYPCFILSQDNVVDTAQGGTNERDNFGYAVNLTWAHRKAVVGLNDPAPAICEVRQKLFSAFSQWRIQGIPGVSRCMVEPRGNAAVPQQEEDLLMSGMVLRFMRKQERGLT